jgi:dihydropteroate synthase
MRDKSILKDKSLKVMAIINYTPDSFYDGGIYYTKEKFFDRVEECVNAGADIIDIGAASTRPGSPLIDPKKEWELLKDLIPEVRKKYKDVLISVDTYNSYTAEKCIENNVDIINDISGGQFDSQMLDVISKSKVYYVLMHTSDIPERMQQKTNYTNVVQDVFNFLKSRIEVLKDKGFSNIIVDPGFGFGKTIEQNYELLYQLDFFQSLQEPILVGLSRKSMVYKKLQVTPQDDEALIGTIALNTIAVMKGASILRVHDVKEAVVIKKLL